MLVLSLSTGQFSMIVWLAIIAAVSSITTYVDKRLISFDSIRIRTTDPRSMTPNQNQNSSFTTISQNNNESNNNSTKNSEDDICRHNQLRLVTLFARQTLPADEYDNICDLQFLKLHKNLPSSPSDALVFASIFNSASVRNRTKSSSSSSSSSSNSNHTIWIADFRPLYRLQYFDLNLLHLNVLPVLRFENYPARFANRPIRIRFDGQNYDLELRENNREDKIELLNMANSTTIASITRSTAATTQISRSPQSSSSPRILEYALHHFQFNLLSAPNISISIPAELSQYVRRSYIVICVNVRNTAAQCKLAAQPRLQIISIIINGTSDEPPPPPIIDCYCDAAPHGFVIPAAILLLLTIFLIVLAARHFVQRFSANLEPEVQINPILCTSTNAIYEYLIIFRVGPASIGFDFDSTFIDVQLLARGDEPIGIPYRYACANLPDDLLAEMHMVICRLSPMPTLAAIQMHHSSSLIPVETTSTGCSATPIPYPSATKTASSSAAPASVPPPTSDLLFLRTSTNFSAIYLQDVTVYDLRTDRILQADRIERFITTEPNIFELKFVDDAKKARHYNQGKDDNRRKLAENWLPLISIPAPNATERVIAAIFAAGLVSALTMHARVCSHVYEHYYHVGRSVGEFLISSIAICVITLAVISVIETIFICVVKRRYVIEHRRLLVEIAAPASPHPTTPPANQPTNSNYHHILRMTIIILLFVLGIGFEIYTIYAAIRSSLTIIDGAIWSGLFAITCSVTLGVWLTCEDALLLAIKQYDSTRWWRRSASSYSCFFDAFRACCGASSNSSCSGLLDGKSTSCKAYKSGAAAAARSGSIFAKYLTTTTSTDLNHNHNQNNLNNSCSNENNNQVDYDYYDHHQLGGGAGFAIEPKSNSDKDFGKKRRQNRWQNHYHNNRRQSRRAENSVAAAPLLLPPPFEHRNQSVGPKLINPKLLLENQDSAPVAPAPEGATSTTAAAASQLISKSYLKFMSQRNSQQQQQAAKQQLPHPPASTSPPPPPPGPRSPKMKPHHPNLTKSSLSSTFNINKRTSNNKSSGISNNSSKINRRSGSVSGSGSGSGSGLGSSSAVASTLAARSKTSSSSSKNMFKCKSAKGGKKPSIGGSRQSK